MAACGINHSPASQGVTAEVPSNQIDRHAELATWQDKGANIGEKYSASLLVAPFAKEPKYFKYPDGRQQLTYMIETEYPAQGVLSFLRKELARNGWKPLPHNFFAPDTPSSFQRGWIFIEDHTQTPSTGVYGWGADWENGSHDITSYSLKYESPTNSTRNLKNLQVLALYMPAAVATKMKQNFDKIKRERDSKPR